MQCQPPEAISAFDHCCVCVDVDLPATSASPNRPAKKVPGAVLMRIAYLQALAEAEAEAAAVTDRPSHVLPAASHLQTACGGKDTVGEQQVGCLNIVGRTSCNANHESSAGPACTCQRDYAQNAGFNSTASEQTKQSQESDKSDREEPDGDTSIHLLPAAAGVVPPLVDMAIIDKLLQGEFCNHWLQRSEQVTCWA